MKSFKIQKIEKSTYSGMVYNLELQTNDCKNDDLFWVCNGIIVHNCFPKDLNALSSIAKENGVNPIVMEAAWEKNLEVRGPDDRDWEKMKGRAVADES
jgi:UDPglucose 6-dehydrogenase